MTVRAFVMLLVAAVTLLSARGADADFAGTVIAVADGDTVTVRSGNRRVKVRLHEIDAPERDQAWGQESRQVLADRVLRRRVFVRTAGVDDYGRTLGRLSLETARGARPDAGIDVNAQMVQSGNAWAYRQYLIDQSLLVLEDEARQARRGLWSIAGAVPPWLFRHPGARIEPLFPHTEPDGECGNKRYCRDMVDCAEAMMYLGCGIPGLDGDGDGIPCEAICG